METLGQTLLAVEVSAQNGQWAQAAEQLGRVLEATASDKSAQIQLGIRLTQLLVDAGAPEIAFGVAQQIIKIVGPINADSIVNVDVEDAIGNFLMVASATNHSSRYEQVLEMATHAAIEATNTNWLYVFRLVGLAQWEAILGDVNGHSQQKQDQWFIEAKSQLSSPLAIEVFETVRSVVCEQETSPNREESLTRFARLVWKA